MRRERRERIVGDLRLRAGDRADERGFADVREAEQADVGHHLQLEAELPLFARLARLGAARGAIVGRREMDVAAPAFAALRDDDLPARRVDVEQKLAALAIEHLRADRDAHDVVLRAAAVHVLAVTVLAVLRAQRPGVGKVEERREALVGLKHDIAAATPVPTRRAAEGDEFLPPEGDRAVSAFAGGDVHFARVDELHRSRDTTSRDSPPMKIHHLNLVTMCPFGGRLVSGGQGPVLATGELVAHALLVETPRDGLVLVDTGIGLDDMRAPRRRLGIGFFELARPRLDLEQTAARQVERLGFKREDVRHIVPTHLDVDHAGGLPDFPDAKVHVHRKERDAALTRPTFKERERYRPKQLAHGPKWEVYDDGGDTWRGLGALKAIAEDVLLASRCLVTRAGTLPSPFASPNQGRPNGSCIAATPISFISRRTTPRAVRRSSPSSSARSRGTTRSAAPTRSASASSTASTGGAFASSPRTIRTNTARSRRPAAIAAAGCPEVPRPTRRQRSRSLRERDLAPKVDVSHARSERAGCRWAYIRPAFLVDRPDSST